MEIKSTVTVECDKCEAVFRAKVGWQAYDERVWLRMNTAQRRRGCTMRRTQGAGEWGNQLPPVTGWEMRIPLRVRECRDHGEGTEGCRGALTRANGKTLAPGRG